MKLITKFRDYYDNMFKKYEDKLYKFVRETSNFNYIPYIRGKRIEMIYDDLRYELSFGVVGFCGKIYPYIQCEHQPSHYSFDYTENKNPIVVNEYYYSYNDIIKDFVGIDNGAVKLTRTFFENITINDIKTWFNSGTLYFKSNHIVDVLNDQKLKNIFINKSVAYFTFNCEKSRTYDETNAKNATIITLYPILSDLQFYKVFDIYTTFQMIQNFLLNQLIKPDTINIKITDEMKAQSKGFNKWSFRKMKD